MPNDTNAVTTYSLPRWLGKNHWLNGKHWLIAFVFSILLLAGYYYANIKNIDSYGQFIFGDTIYQGYSKITDIRLIPYWFVFFAFSNLLILGMRCFLEKPVITAKFRQASQWIMHYQERLTAAAIVLLSAYFYYLILRIFLIKSGISNALIILITLGFLYVISYKPFHKATVLFQSLLVFTPLLYLYEQYNYQGEAITFALSPWQVSFFALITGYLIFSHYRHWRQKSLLTNATMFSIAIFLIGTSGRFYLSDEYHLGEIFTSYHQIITLDQTAYSEFIPTKGFMHILVGWINQLFFDGGYLTLEKSIKIVPILSVFSLIILMDSIKTNKLLGVFIIFSGVYFTSPYYYPFLLGLLLFSSPVIFQNHFRFIAIFAYFSTLFFFYYNAFAVIFILCLLPLFIYHCINYAKQPIVISKSIKHLLIIALPVVFLVSNLDLVLASIDYLLVNSSANLFYWGNSGKLGRFLGGNLWFVLYVFLGFMLLKRRIPLTNQTIPWISVIFIAPFLLLTYLEARADGTFTRALHYTNFIALLFICLSISLYQMKQNKAAATLILIGILSFFSSNGKLYFRFKSGANTFMTRYIEPPYVLNDSNTMNLGQGFLPKKQLQQLKQEEKLFGSLSKNETFLIVDEYITQSARYSIMNKKIPTISHSVLNIPSLAAWKKELEKIEQNHVKIVRVSSGLKRYMLLYNYLMSHDFRLIEYYGKPYLVTPDILAKITNKLVFTEKNVQEAYQMVSTSGFGFLPVKWGSAINQEHSNMQFIQQIDKLIRSKDIVVEENLRETESTYYQLGYEDPYFVYQVEAVSGQQANILTLSIDGLEEQQCLATLYWSDEKGFKPTTTNKVSFRVKNGPLAIPLGMNYYWNNQINIQALRLDIDECPQSTLKLSPLMLYKY